MKRIQEVQAHFRSLVDGRAVYVWGGNGEEITPEIELLAGGAGSSLGTGGMLTKVTAAKRATEAGVDMIITNGAHADVLYDIVEGKPVGTRFVGRKA